MVDPPCPGLMQCQILWNRAQSNGFSGTSPILLWTRPKFLGPVQWRAARNLVSLRLTRTGVSLWLPRYWDIEILWSALSYHEVGSVLVNQGSLFSICTVQVYRGELSVQWKMCAKCCGTCIMFRNFLLKKVFRSTSCSVHKYKQSYFLLW